MLAPTRELCQQITSEALKFAHGTDLKVCQVIGGVPCRPQLAELSGGVDLLVATPGRVWDYVERGVLSFYCCGFLVFDEADRMLDMGFEPQIRRIVEQSDMMTTAEGRQTLMFSATFAPEIRKLAHDFLVDPITVTVGQLGMTVEGVEQRIMQVRAGDKPATLAQLFASVPGSTLVFVERKITAGWLKRHMAHLGVRDSVAVIHGDIKQQERDAALEAFRSGRARVLIATDVAARGLDLPNVKHVVNYALPSNGAVRVARAVLARRTDAARAR